MIRTALIRPLLAITTMMLAAASACGGDSTDTRPTPSATAAGTAIASPIIPPHVDPTPLVEVTGLFSDPRETHVDEYRSLGPKPSTFAPWDGTSTMLYDTQTGTETNLGPGSLGRFSPDSTKMVWIANAQPPFGDGDAMVIDLATMRKQSFGPGTVAEFVDNDHVGITRPDTTGSGRRMTESVEMTTGERTPVRGVPFYSEDTTRTPDGYRLLGGGKLALGTYTLTNTTTNALLLKFDALVALPAGRGAIVVATEPVDAGPPIETGYRPATTNIFLVDIVTGQARFIATTRYLLQFPLAANESYVIWTEDYCATTQGHTRIYDRRTGRITEIDATLWPKFTPGRLIIAGPFGGDALIDPDTLEYRTALPADGGSWSPDYRYASLGQVGGHGGLCP